MDLSIFELPLLDTSDKDSDFEQVHKTLTALRELYNTRNQLRKEKGMPYGELDGTRFGLSELYQLLESPSVLQHYKIDRPYLDQKFFEPDTEDEMAVTVRWATNVFLEYILPENRRNYIVSSALKKIDPVKELLSSKKVALIARIERQKLAESAYLRIDKMINLLEYCFDLIRDYHIQHAGSRAGFEAIILVAKEIDFVNLKMQLDGGLEKVLHALISYNISMHKCVESIKELIVKELGDRGHPMPIEYALKTMADTLPALTMNSFDIALWASKFERLGLRGIGQKLRATISDQPGATSLSNAIPEALMPTTVYGGTHLTSLIDSTAAAAAHNIRSSPSAYMTAITHASPENVDPAHTVQPHASPTQSITTSALQRAYDEEETTSPLPKSLSGTEPDEATQNTTPQEPKHGPIMPLADGPGLGPQESDTRHKPANTPSQGTPHPPKAKRGSAASLPDQSRQSPATQIYHASASESYAARKKPRYQSSQLSHTDLEIPATPAISDHGSMYTGQSTPAEKHAKGVNALYWPADHNLKGQKQNLREPGMDESAAACSQRLHRAMAKAGSFTPALGGVEEEEHADVNEPDKTKTDRDGDSVMEGAVATSEEKSSDTV